MPNIKPISDLKNYTAVVSEVKYGSRVYLTKNGHGNITMIDMQELDEIEKELAIYKFKYEMAVAEKSIEKRGLFRRMIWRQNWGLDNLREIEYSQIVRTKLMNLRVELAAEYGEKFSRKALGKVTKAVRSLEVYCDRGTKITYV